MWSQDRQQQQQLETCQECKYYSSPQTYLIINSEGGAQQTFNKLFRGFSMLKFEDHCSSKAMVITVRSKTNICIGEVTLQFSKFHLPHLHKGYRNIQPAQFSQRLNETGKNTEQIQNKLNFPFLSLEKQHPFLLGPLTFGHVCSRHHYLDFQCTLWIYLGALEMQVLGPHPRFRGGEREGAGNSLL